ncbi:putative ankyrin domain protein ank12 [Wolbachia endosymbiont of Trichogramma pretiosum]|nr:putative ankyrin domain protein ank12 [Wolbachia endosymbiont of Trichogramma pretiosum]
MDKLSQDTKNKLRFWWLITVIVCIIVTLRIASQNCDLEIVKFSVKNLLDTDTHMPKLTALHHAAEGNV